MAQESRQDSALSAHQIIALADSYGFSVSPKQLKRWQNAGLIPRPRQLYVTGVPGSKALYPNHAGDQVCALCRIGEHFRDHGRIGWYLWRLGWPVDEKYWMPVFFATIKYLDDFLKPNLEPAETAEYPSNGGPKFELSDRLLEAVQKTSKRPISHPRAGPLKQRLGAEKFGSLAARCLDIVVGNFTRDPPVVLTEISDEELSLPKILERTFAQDEFHTEFITKVFEFLSGTVTAGTLVDQFRSFSANQLQFVSGEIGRVEGLLPALMGKSDEIPKINGVPAFSLKSGIRDQAMLILGWCVARQMTANAENLERLHGKNEILPQ